MFSKLTLLVMAALVLVAVLLPGGSTSAATIPETERLRNKILVQSGLQIVNPSVVKGFREVWNLGKQIVWAAKVLACQSPCFVFDPPQTALFTEPVVVDAPAAVLPFTEAEVRGAFDPNTTGVGVVSPALINALTASNEDDRIATANLLAFARAAERARAACAASDLESFAARRGGAEAFAAVVTSESLQSASALGSALAELVGSGLPDPVVTLAQQQAFLADVSLNGLPAPEPALLAQLGVTSPEIQQITDLIVNGVPGSGFVLQEFSFGTSLQQDRDLNLELPAIMQSELNALTCNVGGIAELPEVAASPLETGGSSGGSTGVLAGAIAGAVLVGGVTLGGVAWYARRRLSG